MYPPSSSSIGNLTIKGHLTAAEDVAVEGIFEGEIDLHGHHLTIGEHSQVNASVSARVVTVLGRLQGHVTADLVDVGPTAIVDANVITRQLGLEEGARFNGSVNTERARAAREIARHRAAEDRKQTTEDGRQKTEEGKRSPSAQPADHKKL